MHAKKSHIIFSTVHQSCPQVLNQIAFFNLHAYESDDEYKVQQNCDQYVTD